MPRRGGLYRSKGVLRLSGLRFATCARAGAVDGLYQPLPGSRTFPRRGGRARGPAVARVRCAVVPALPGGAAGDRGAGLRASAAAAPEDRGRPRQAAGTLVQGEAVADPGAAARWPGTGAGGTARGRRGPAAAARGAGGRLSGGMAMDAMKYARVALLALAQAGAALAGDGKDAAPAQAAAVLERFRTPAEGIRSGGRIQAADLPALQ